MSELRRHLQVIRESWKQRKTMQDEKRSMDEVAFLPAALEVQQTPPSPIGRAISYLVILFFLLAIIWACIGKVDIVSVAQGKIIPSGKSKIIQPLELGKVAKIYVREGDRVKQGDPLVDLDPTSVQADVDQIAAELQMIKASHLRTVTLYNAIQTSANQPNPLKPSSVEPIDDSIMQAQQDNMQSQFDEYQARKQALHNEIKRKQAEHQMIQENIHKHEKILPIIETRANAMKKLSSDNLVAKNDYYQLEQERIEQAQDLAALRSQSIETQQAIQQARAQLNTVTAELKKTIFQEKAELESRLSSLKMELVKATTRERLQHITAPVDGVVQQLAVHTVGGVVTPAQELMVIVPQTEQLEAEVYIENKDVGFIQEDQIAEVKLDAFPFTKYGTIDGEIMHISNDAIENERLGWVFMSRVSLAKSTMQVGERLVNLSPGMQVSVEVKTGKRRLIEFFLSPLLRYQKESIKER